MLDALRIKSFVSAVIRDKNRDRVQVTPREKTFLRQKISAAYTRPMLYDHWVRMYKRREPIGHR